MTEAEGVAFDMAHTLGHAQRRATAEIAVAFQQLRQPERIQHPKAVTMPRYPSKLDATIDLGNRLNSRSGPATDSSNSWAFS